MKPFLFLCFSLCFFPAAGQFSGSATHYTRTEGLPHDRCNDVQADRDGFVWVATGGGVSRFDGFRFKNYLHRSEDARYWGIWGFTTLALDKTGRIWASSQDHLFYFDARYDRFEHYPLPASDEHNLDLMDNPGDSLVWVEREGRIYTIDPLTMRLDSLRLPRKKQYQTVWLDAPRQWIWFGNHHHTDTILIYDIRKGTAEKLPFPENRFGKSSFSYFRDGQGRTWIGSETLWMHDPSTGRWQNWWNKSAQNAPVWYYTLIPSLCNDSLLWLINNPGIHCFDLRTEQFVNHILADREITIPHAQSAVQTDGQAWIATNTGLFRFDNRAGEIHRQRLCSEESPAVAGSSGGPSAPLPHRGNPDRAWFAIFGDGAVLYDKKERRVVRRYLDFRKGEAPKEVANAIKPFYSRSGRLWVFCQGGIVALDEKTGAYKTVTNDPEFHWIWNYATDRDGYIWFEHRHRFYRENEDGLGFHPVELPFMKTLSQGVHYFDFDGQNRLWVATQGEIIRYHPASGQCERLPIDWSLIETPAQREMRSCELDRLDNFWFSTLEGLYKCEFDRGIFKNYNYRHGLLSGYGEDIALDAEQNIWLSTRNGLFRFDRNTERFTKITLPGIETEETCLIEEGDGKVYLLHQFKGYFTAFDPRDFRGHAATAPLITGFRISDRPWPFDRDSVRAFPLPVLHRQNVLQFEFTSVDFHDGKNLAFRHRLHGFDPDWVYSGPERTVTYTNLDPGTYTFEVQAANAEGEWTAQSAVFKIRVIPPYYRTRWFYALCLLTFGGILYAVFRYRERQRLEKERIRMRIARDLHDEVGSTLSSISILSDAALSGIEQDLEKQQLGNIGEKARSALDSMSDIVWAVNPRNDSMEKVVERMARFAADILEPAGIELQFQSSADIRNLQLPMEKRKDFYLIFKEAVTNCAKYSRAQTVRIRLEKNDGQLELTVQDDGVGFGAAQTTPQSNGGNGLLNMRQRAAALGADFAVHSAPGNGASVTLRLPLVP